MLDLFRRFAQKSSEVVGSFWSFIVAIAVIVIWAITGSAFQFSDSWQLVINTATTIITFLMVFLIQNTQNRDAKAIHLKLDELIRSSSTASNKMLDLEHSSDRELNEMQHAFEELHRIYEQRKDAISKIRKSRRPS